MLLTITTTGRPATDLGYLLFKHPGKLQEFDLKFGTGRVFYPQADEDRCTAALAVAIDPFALVEQKRGQGGEAAYVSDKPYVAGSYMAVAIARTLKSAMAGRCDSRPELAASAIPLEVEVTPVACRSRAAPEELFGPLGWSVESTLLPLDPDFPEWGDAVYRRLRLIGTLPLSEALRHLYVLLPVLDGRKHYFFADDEVANLLRQGDGWLEGHPARDTIVRRYLGSRRRLVEAAADALAGPPEADDVPDAPEAAAVGEAALERPLRLQEARVAAAVETLAAAGARRVADVGCGEGDLVAAIMADRRFDGVVGVEPSPYTLQKAVRRLGYERMQDLQRARVTLLQGAATYPDPRLSGCDAFALLEVVEHVDPWRLGMLEEAVFGFASPRLVLVTTPNREANARFPGLADGALRHRDHRFEWTRDEFRAWCGAVCAARGYSFRWFPVGPEDETLGPVTQGALFTRTA